MLNRNNFQGKDYLGEAWSTSWRKKCCRMLEICGNSIFDLQNKWRGESSELQASKGFYSSSISFIMKKLMLSIRGNLLRKQINNGKFKCNNVQY